MVTLSIGGSRAHASVIQPPSLPLARAFASYALLNPRGSGGTYLAVCGKQVTLRCNADPGSRCGRNRTTAWNVRWPAIRAWGRYHSRVYWIDGRRIRAALKAPQRKRPCRSRALPVDRSFFFSWRFCCGSCPCPARREEPVMQS